MSGMTDVGIANLALVDLGEPALTALEDQGKAARIMRTIFEPTVLEVLRGHPWRCARKLVVLADDPDATPPFGFDNACMLPADFVKVVKVNNNIDKFQVNGLHLHIDDTAPELTYVARVPTSQFDAGLVSVISARLAARACIAVTDNATTAANLAKVYESTLADAKYADALDGAEEELPIGTWAQTRISEA